MYTVEELTEYFSYLDDLRESGVTNMFGAGQYVENAFDIPRRQASKILSIWMETFDSNIMTEVRANNYLKQSA